MNLIFHFIYGMSSFPLTNSYFSRWLLHHQAVMIFQWTVQPVFPEGIAMATGTSVLFTGETLVGGLLYKTTWSFSILYYGDIIGISNNQHSPSLLIYQWPGWWFGTMEWIMTFQKQLGMENHPNCYSLRFFRGLGWKTTSQWNRGCTERTGGESAGTVHILSTPGWLCCILY